MEVLCALPILTAVALHFSLVPHKFYSLKEKTDTKPKTDATELLHQLLCNKKTAKNFHPVVQVNKMVHCPKIG